MKNSNLTRTKSYTNFRVLLIIDNNRSKIDNTIRTITERNLKKNTEKMWTFIKNLYDNEYRIVSK